MKTANRYGLILVFSLTISIIGFAFDGDPIIDDTLINVINIIGTTVVLFAGFALVNALITFCYKEVKRIADA